VRASDGMGVFHQSLASWTVLSTLNRTEPTMSLAASPTLIFTFHAALTAPVTSARKPW